MFFGKFQYIYNYIYDLEALGIFTLYIVMRAGE